MAERPRIDLFCEDRGHEQFVRALVHRLAEEAGIRPALRALSTRGGRARALGEFSVWQKEFLRPGRQGLPDLLILVVDANCTGWNEMRHDLEEAVDRSVVPRVVLGCPDPHVERWYIADPAAFEQVVGARPARDPGKCERHVYKRLVDAAVEAAGLPLLTGPADLAPDLAGQMNLFQAGKNQSSLRHFVDDLRTELRALATAAAAG